MSRQAKEDRYAGFSYRSEQVTCDHLETDDEHGAADDTHGSDGLINEIYVMRKHLRDDFGETLAGDKDDSHDARRLSTGQVEGLQQSVHMSRAVVITGDRLHTLVETHYHHGEDEGETVDNSV
mgnify:CR=1 FL=1